MLISWLEVAPNLLIGLREGLEAGLVVTVLLSAMRKLAPGRSTAPIWIGVAAAVSLAGSVAAILTFTTAALPIGVQDAVGGGLSVLAVGLVTWMVFWMRRTARALSAELTERVGSAARVGAGALAVTAFLAVGREGLETTLFLWTAVRASGSTVAPLTGALVGILLAILLCWLLVRGAVRVNLTVFFTRTAVALIVVAAGILSYGLGDLQEAGLLPGISWTAFDLTGWSQAGSWWVALLSGVTDLQPKMTVLSTAAWLLYLAAVLPAFLRRQTVASPGATRAPSATRSPESSATGRRRSGRRIVVGGAVLAVPALVAAVLIGAAPARAASSTAVQVTDRSCGAGWTAGTAGTTDFAVTDRSDRAGEVNLDDASGAVVAELETIGPGTTTTMTATLNPGTYTFRCYLAGRAATTGAPVTVTGRQVASATTPVHPPTLAELTGPNLAYQDWATARLVALQGDLRQLREDEAAGRVSAARTAWLQAQLQWEQVGASYDSFGALGEAVDALPDEFEHGVHDPAFTGLHRLEYDLWHDVSRTALLGDTVTTEQAVAAVQAHLTSDDLAGDPTVLPVRAHEIIEDALRDHLSGLDDQGAHAGYALTAADVTADRTVVDDLAPLLTTRQPHLVDRIHAQLATLQTALDALQHPDGSWAPLGTETTGQRERVDAATDALLETLAQVPDLLEVPPAQQ